jgi:hypothetical protein
VGGQHHAPATLPPGKTRYPFDRRLGGPQGRCGLLRKISPPPAFDPRSVQPVAGRYTTELTGPHTKCKAKGKGHPLTVHQEPKGGAEV